MARWPNPEVFNTDQGSQFTSFKDYATTDELIEGLTEYFTFYDEERVHRSLSKRTPWEVYGAVPGRRSAQSDQRLTEGRRSNSLFSGR